MVFLYDFEISLRFTSCVEVYGPMYKELGFNSVSIPEYFPVSFSPTQAFSSFQNISVYIRSLTIVLTVRYTFFPSDLSYQVSQEYY